MTAVPDATGAAEATGRTWVARGVAAGLLVAFVDALFGAPAAVLGVGLASAAVLVPGAAALGAVAWLAARRGARLPIPEAAASLTLAVGSVICAAAVRGLHRFVATRDVEFPGPVGLALDAGSFVAILAVAGGSFWVLWPLARRVLSGEHHDRRVAQALSLLGVVAALAALHRGLAPVHDHLLAPVVGPAALVLALVWASLCVRPAAGSAARAELALLVAGLAVVLIAAVGPCGSPGIRYLIWSRAHGALPLLAAARAACDWDGDGAHATWLGGTDCAPLDPDVGPFRRERPGDGVDDDCRGGDAAEPARTEAAPALLADPAWAACLADLRSGGPPNVVLVTLDAVRADALSPATAPALGRFARRSAWFTRAYAPATHSFGSLPALFAARPLSDLGAPDLHARGGAPDHPQDLLLRLKSAGYHTRALTVFSAGKAIARGFDRFGAGALDPPGIGGPKGGFAAGALTDQALAFLAAQDPANAQAPPFFLWLHHLDTHAPYVPIDRRAFPAPEGSDYQREVAYTALHVARLVEGLAAMPIGARTVVALTADHGEDLGERGLEGHGPDVYDGSTAVPLALMAPGCPGRLVEDPVSVLDLARALLALTSPPGAAAGGALGPDPAVVSEVYMLGAMRRAVVAPDGFKLVVDVRNGGARLFDLHADPGETDDRYGRDAAATARLEALYQAWLDRPVRP